jgi:membrane protease YdiL (CAAX protease family)
LADTLMQAMAVYAPDSTFNVLEGLHGLARSQPVWLLWPALALLPGVSEELLFRGLLLRSFTAPAIGVLASGVAFALFHVDPRHIAGVLPLGLFLSWVASRSSTSVTIFAHIANNTMALVATHVAALDVGYGTERPMPEPWLPVSLGLFALCVLEIARVSRRPTA